MNAPLTLLLHFSIVLAGALALRLANIRTRVLPLVLGFGVVILYWLISPLGLQLQSAIPMLAALKWNWLGKIFVIVASLAALALTRVLTAEEIGLTVRQREGSALPAVVAIALICVFSWGFNAWLNDGRDLSTERLLYQAIMPGLDEELVYRGILLALFTRAVPTHWTIFGARIGVAEIAVTFLFAAGHGIYVTVEGLKFIWHGLVEASVIGFGLVWLRRRTGSLVAPIFAHNLANFGNGFF